MYLTHLKWYHKNSTTSSIQLKGWTSISFPVEVCFGRVVSIGRLWCFHLAFSHNLAVAVGGHNFLSTGHSLLTVLRKKVHLQNGNYFERCHPSYSNFSDTSSLWVGLLSHQLIGVIVRAAAWACGQAEQAAACSLAECAALPTCSSVWTATQTADIDPNRCHSLFVHPGRGAHGGWHSLDTGYVWLPMVWNGRGDHQQRHTFAHTCCVHDIPETYVDSLGHNPPIPTSLPFITGS